jgi:hypothetical protein
VFPSPRRLGEAIDRRFQPSGDENKLPGTGVLSCGGILNASEETIGRGKKFPTFAPKLVQIVTAIGQFSAGFDIVAQSFCFCERMFRLIQIIGMKGGRLRQSIPISTTAEAGPRCAGGSVEKTLRVRRRGESFTRKGGSQKKAASHGRIYEI